MSCDASEYSGFFFLPLWRVSRILGMSDLSTVPKYRSFSSCAAVLWIFRLVFIHSVSFGLETGSVDQVLVPSVCD